ncbi:MAG: putative toxin-antitoxin system toxin component, PIN family [Candidatus Coatesbacteria bacterium]
MKVVLDANVLVSAVFGGIPRLALNRALREELWVSADTEEELLGLTDRLSRIMKPAQLLEWKANLGSFLSSVHRGSVKEPVRLSRDRDDDPYLSLAKAIGADFLVTGDKDLLSIEHEQLDRISLGRLKIVTPRQFLKQTSG